MTPRHPLVLTLPARPTPEDLAALCARLAGAPPGDVLCELGALAAADLGTVDALARLKLAATRSGHRLRFRGAGTELRALLLLTGLAGTLGG